MSFVASTKVGEQTHFGTFDVDSEEEARSALLAQLEADGVELPKSPRVSVEGAPNPALAGLENSQVQLEAEHAEAVESFEAEHAATQEHIEDAH